MVRLSRLGAGAAVALVVLSLSAACGGSSSAAPCSPDKQIPLISTRLDSAAPSPPFRVGTKTRVFAATTTTSGEVRVIGGASGIARLSVIPDGGQPAVTVDGQGFTHTSDPSVVLRQPRQWVRLPVAAGTWRMYSIDLSASGLPVTAVACPR